MKVDLYRAVDTAGATFGSLFLSTTPICLTLELPWKCNRRNVSCIQAGEYDCIPFFHNKWGRCWHVRGVPNRSEIVIHPANRASELKGCIAPGTFYWEDGVGSSRSAIKKLEVVTNLKPFTLKIHDLSV